MTPAAARPQSPDPGDEALPSAIHAGVVRLTLGAEVRCADGPYGKLVDVAIAPAERRVTHLVIQPEGGHGLARLVAADLASSAAQDGRVVELRCTRDTVDQCELVQQVDYLAPGESPKHGADTEVGIQEVVAVPYYDAAGADIGWVGPTAQAWVTYDQVPKGDVELRRASRVSTADGHEVGHVEAFAVGDDGAITHVVVRHGHLWRKHDVTIAIRDVGQLTSDRVELVLSRQDVSELD
jgi:hypothetical protein